MEAMYQHRGQGLVAWLQRIGHMVAARSDYALAIGVAVIIMTLIIPLPPVMLDLLLTFNFSYVLLFLMVVLGLKDPLNFSTFPSLLLIGTLYRLALNVASTRLILLEAYAGDVIDSFGQFVVGGNVVVGLVIFLILIVIQFVVITKGSERISEVGARFTLDAMPGKQMSIDADLNAGLIGEEQARERRHRLVAEADFYGAMDGASKYVRGDAVAGIVIVLINIIGGIIIGLTRGMSVGQAVGTYSLLTVGDGLVTQIPAIIMSVSAGILVTKSASEEGLSAEMGVQIFENPRAIAAAATIIFAFMLMPGLPALPFFVLGTVLTGSYVALRGQRLPEGDAAKQQASQATPQGAESTEETMHSMIEPDRISVEVGYNLIRLIDPNRGGTLLDRIKTLRKKVAGDTGIVLPKVRIIDNVELAPNKYLIKLMGHQVAEGEVYPNKLMCMKPEGQPKGIDGIKTKEPSFGLPVIWVNQRDRENARSRGMTVVDAESVFITHLSEVLRRHAHEVLNRQDVKALVDNVREKNPAIVEGLVPEKLSLSQVQQVLQNLLVEGVPVNNLSHILEKLGNYADHLKDPSTLSELVRKSLSRAISARFCDGEGRINALSFDPALEEEIQNAIEKTNGDTRINLSPQRVRLLITAISEKTRQAFSAGGNVVLLVDSQIRPYVRGIISRVFPDIPVISYDEIAENVEVNNVGVINIGL